MIAAWKRFGLAMSRLTTPVFIVIMFVVVFTPIALVLRLVRRRPLRDGFDGGAKSYWIAVPSRGQTLRDFQRPF